MNRKPLKKLAALTLMLGVVVVTSTLVQSSRDMVALASIEPGVVDAGPARVVRTRTQDPSELLVSDRWYPVLADLSNELADAYAERNERPIGKAMRMSSFAEQVLDAVDARSELGSNESLARWQYAVTLIWIAHRETRIAANPKLLGDQDHGKAHGAWQIWEWKGKDPYSASTAIDMMLASPGAWYLPKDTPWVGYPDCDKWLREHPAPRPRWE